MNDDIDFGLTTRQVNLLAIRIQTLWASRFPSLANAVTTLNVAQSDQETIDIPVSEMSPQAIIAFVVSVVAANNAALSDQLLAMGLKPTAPAVVPTIDL